MAAIVLAWAGLLLGIVDPLHGRLNIHCAFDIIHLAAAVDNVDGGAGYHHATYDEREPRGDHGISSSSVVLVVVSIGVVPLRSSNVMLLRPGDDAMTR